MKQSRIAQVLATVALVGCGGSSAPSRVLATNSAGNFISAGEGHTCVIVEGGDVLCWGNNEFGQLGYGHTEVIGDDETPASAGVVDLGGSAKEIAAGKHHTCALLLDGTVRCWGNNAFGQLGYAHTDTIGDNETPAERGEVVDVGGSVKQIAVGGFHTCALLESGAVRCWGEATSGRLGYGNTDLIGDNENPSAAGDVPVGGAVSFIGCGDLHTCALLESGAVRCWGRGHKAETEIGGFGQLGYGELENVGDKPDNTPELKGDVMLGGSTALLAVGGNHNCAVLDSGTTRCWGRGDGRDGHGQLGTQTIENIGDNETPLEADLPAIIGGTPQAIYAGEIHSCAKLSSSDIRCWGFGGFGQLGYGNADNIGDDEPPAQAGPIDTGFLVDTLVLGARHTCATSGGDVVCWGLGATGQLGYPNTDKVGVEETPAALAPVSL